MFFTSITLFNQRKRAAQNIGQSRRSEVVSITFLVVKRSQLYRQLIDNGADVLELGRTENTAEEGCRVSQSMLKGGQG